MGEQIKNKLKKIQRRFDVLPREVGDDRTVSQTKLHSRSPCVRTRQGNITCSLLLHDAVQYAIYTKA